MKKKMRWIALTLVFLFALVPVQVNADEGDDMSLIAEVTEPEVTEPEVTEPEITEPEVTEPEVTEPEVTEPEVTEPDVTEPEATEPDAAEPTDVPEQEKTFLEELWAIIVHCWGVVSQWVVDMVHNIYAGIKGQ